MSIATYDPWGVFGSRQNFLPAVDVREEAGRFVVEADLPGVAPSDIEVTAEKGILTVRGERVAVDARRRTTTRAPAG